MAASMGKFVFFFFIYFSSVFLVISGSFRKDIYSTKTAYSWVYDTNKNVDLNEQMSTKFGNKTCAAVNVQAFLRHGARYPGYKDIRKMTALHEKLKLTVKSPEYPFLRKWENDFPESEEKQLVDEGEEEQYLLGQRFGKRLLQLYGDSMKNVKFISSSKDRCTESALSFYEGLTEIVLHEAFDDLKPIINDEILRFHTKCGKFIEEVENDRSHMKFHKKFKISSEMNNVVDRVRKRLGVEHATLNAGELKLIYFWCTFEMIILEKDDWCHLLTDEDREVIEYHNDLKQYWKKAYGHPVIAEMACPLMTEIFGALDKVIASQLNNRNQRGNVATFYFGHTESLAPLYAALGLFNDTSPLLDSNFHEMKDRVFKSSRILPFSANIAMVLYKCDYETEPEPSVNDFVLRFYVNEEPVIVPACGDYVCSYSKVRDMYTHHVDRCDFENVCRTKVHDEL
ncbi:multiple inositol polyphosphate phosphatase 1-like [Mercenaria mercenaria]|uniref:multiple inositol polyphosphate phosphatase 1-like n=1 Tax=Mercenaria mercenaria TaxID=6596 RepID=UPI00234F07FD|nr:multiple inositol polyphosphate phosphatase 1-like [Mercenaria mercenaria]